MMRRYLIIALAAVSLALGHAASAQDSPLKAFVRPLEERDSILIADQIRYGASLEGLAPGTAISLPDLKGVFNDTLVLVSDWSSDTLKVHRRHRAVESVDVELSIVVSPFEEGSYRLPDLPVLRGDDTLVFEGSVIEVGTIPLDTATFEIHDLKPQMRYPLTFSELVPYIIGFQLLTTLVTAAVCIILMRRRRGQAVELPKEPAYVVALRALDKYRGDKYWAPDKQKIMYSGITDALRTYIERRFDVNAEEMTTADIFASLRKRDISPDVYSQVKELFELSDYVKFAKHTASGEENAAAIPTAVLFVTSTYQSQLDEEAAREEEPLK